MRFLLCLHSVAMNLIGRRNMSRKNKTKLLIIVPHGVPVQVIRKKKSIYGNRIKTIKPYYLKTSLYDENGEPLVERDFEG